jgi:hypothetical protein
MPVVCGPASRLLCALGVLLATVRCTGSREYRGATCRGGFGAVRIAFEVVEGPACPEIASYLVEPAEVYLDGVVTVSTSVVSSSDAGTDILWSAQTGFFEDPRAPTTSFFCTQAGTTDVTLDVTSGGCTETITSSVECDNPDAG